MSPAENNCDEVVDNGQQMEPQKTLDGDWGGSSSKAEIFLSGAILFLGAISPRPTSPITNIAFHLPTLENQNQQMKNPIKPFFDKLFECSFKLFERPF